jgi:glycosyltransferase involved in cell wall biosynthesis
MKLALIYPSFTQSGGGETYLLNLMQGLAARGHEIDLFTSAYDEALFGEPKGFTLKPLGGRGFLEGLAGTFRLGRALRPLLKGYDVVVPTSFPSHLWAALARPKAPCVWLCLEPKRNIYPQAMYAEAAGIRAWGYRTIADYGGDWRTLLFKDPHVLLPYGLRSALQRSLDQFAVRQMKTIMTISPYIAKKINQIYRRPSTVVWAGLTPPSAERITSTGDFLLVPTRLEKIKNVEVVLRAARSLPYPIRIVGEGGEAENLRQRIGEWGLSDRVQMLGFVSAAERDALYAQCAAVIYPSLAEPLGLPCIEAGLLGKAVIADRRGGPADLIQDGRTGVLVDMSDPQALVAAVRRVMRDEALRGYLGQNAQAHLSRAMHPTVWLDSIEKALRSCVF